MDIDLDPVRASEPDSIVSEARPGIVAIGASAGGIPALLDLLPELPPTFPLPILVAVHISPVPRSQLAAVLGYKSRLPVEWARERMPPRGGTVYVCPAATHMTLADDGTMRLSSAAPGDRYRPSIDRLFESIAAVHGENSIAVVLSGMLADGARGIQTIIGKGGLAIAQCHRTARFEDMPTAAIDLGRTDIILPPVKIARALEAGAIWHSSN